MAESATFDVFGRKLRVERQGDRWIPYFVEGEGKRRPASDIVISSDIDIDDIATYLDDLLHEWATPRNPSVERIE